MEKTAYPAWKTALWLIGSFLYTIASLILTLVLSLWLLSHIGDAASLYALGFLLLLLAILPWQAYKHQHSPLPVLAVEIATIVLIVWVIYAGKDRIIGDRSFGQIGP